MVILLIKKKQTNFCNLKKFQIADNGNLIIHKTEKHDDGIYRCVASNSIGRDIASAYLRVFG